MKIGFDAKRIVRNRTGLGSYGRTLINALAEVCPDDELLLYAPDEGEEDLRRQVTERGNIRFVFLRSQEVKESRSQDDTSGKHESKDIRLGSYTPALLHSLSKALWRSRGIVKDLRRDGVALFHGLSGELPVGIRKAGIRSVVTIHDLIFLRHPEYYHRLDVWLYRWKFRRTVKEADHIIAISERTKRDIIELGGVSEDRITVVYQSCSTFFKLRESEDQLQDVNARYELPPRYIISVGTIEERKNILLAVKALRLLPEDVSLVVVGRSTPYCQRVKQYVQEQGLAGRVLFLHGVPNSDLPALYQMAEACVYPSRYEGFGIPVIEAIQSGLPVVACTGSCLEEAGGPDCLYVDPDDVEGMARAMALVLKGNPDREERIGRSQQYVRRFENTDVAAQVIDTYRKVEKGER